MTVLTKQDLQDWHSNPVTQEIYKALTEEAKEIKAESCIRDNCDQTAMKVSYNEGLYEGMRNINEAYDNLLAEAE